MSNRRELFRERMVLLNPTADPEELKKHGYYVSPPSDFNTVNQLTTKLELEPDSKCIIIGGIGSGKTTQLYMACEEINKVPDMMGIYIDVSKYTDLTKLQAGSLTAIAGLAISEKINNSSVEINKIREEFLNLYNKRWISPDYHYDYYHDDGGYALDNLLVKPPENNLDDTTKRQLENLKILNKEINKQLVFFFDSLDRINAESFKILVENDLQALSILKIGAVFVGPTELLTIQKNQNIMENFERKIFRHWSFDSNNPDSILFLVKILLQRISENFLSQSNAILIAEFSGGILRHMVSIAKSANENAYMDGSDKIDEKHIRVAAEEFGKSLMLVGVNDEQRRILTLHQSWQCTYLGMDCLLNTETANPFKFLIVFILQLENFLKNEFQ